MINSTTGWYNFNQLMNDLREAITTKGKNILPTLYTNYYLDENDIFSTSGEYKSTIVGISRENTQIGIIVKNNDGENNDFDLTYSGFHPDDFLNLLEILEK